VSKFVPIDTSVGRTYVNVDSIVYLANETTGETRIVFSAGAGSSIVVYKPVEEVVRLLNLHV
jgi:hypothetical protein